MKLNTTVHRDEPISNWKGTTAGDHHLSRDVIEGGRSDLLLKRWGVSLDTPILGKGCDAVALATGKTRVVKITGNRADAQHCWQLAQMNKKIPHLVRVFDVRQIVGGYIMRAERLHTRVDQIGGGFLALGTDWQDVRDIIEKALQEVGMDTQSLGDYGSINVMLDSLQRPTWYDFGWGYIGEEDPPIWDEKAERAKLLARLELNDEG